MRVAAKIPAQSDFSWLAGIYFIKKLLADAGGFCIVVFDFLPI